jgi:hypothetical protein
MAILAAPPTIERSVVPPTVKPALARLLLNRITFGPTQADLDELNTLGYWGYIERQLKPASIDDSAVETFLATNYPALAMTPVQLSGLAFGDVVDQLIRARIVRAALSRRQLLEVMVEMWTDHFNIYNQTSPESFLKIVDDREVIRPNALGSFPKMLRASAHSPAMLSYLDNNTNTRTAPNENYARELMELHSLSASGGYTQADVAAVARCFTGWTYFTGTASNAYTFRYNSGTHDTNAKVLSPIFDVAGGFQGPVTIPARAAANGQQDGEDVLNILVVHPNTARFIALKMLRHLWGYDPPPSMVDSLAQVYLATGGDIKAMIRWVLEPTRLATAPWKFKRPFHLFMSGLRALQATVTSPGSLRSPLTGAGHLPFAWVPPDGYPDSLDAWVGLLLPRWNFGASLLNNEYSGISVNTTALFAGLTSRTQVVDRIALLLHGGAMPPEDRAGLLAYLPNTPSAAQIREACGLAIGYPGFQWY